ncbi:MAG TPA: ATP-binding protein [Roseiflexaceae bacterium]|nr:ATP-binding protein [Roseiflexaceae bacterium]
MAEAANKVNGPLRLAIIDDNEDDRALATRQLERALPGVQILVVTNAEELEQLLDNDRFDLVITDFQLRWSDGLAVLRGVKARYPDLPVIMFTNTGNEEIAVEAMKAGLDDYIVKSRRSFAHLPPAVQAAHARAEARRRAARLETRLQTLLNRLNVGVYQAAPGGEVLEANPALLRLLGVATPAALAGLDLGVLTTLPPVGEQSESREVQLHRADGRPIWVALSQTPGHTGETARVDGLVEDITARRQAQESLAALNATLELRVRERTAQLEAVSADLEAYAAMAAHDLREPLRAIQGFAAAVLEDDGAQLRPRSRLYLERTLNVAHDMDALVGDLLEYSRLGRATLLLQPVELAAAVNAALSELQPLLVARGALVQINNLEADVIAERRALQQVLLNLIRNAVTYVAPGTAPRLHLWAERQDHRMRLWLADNGIGIASEDQGRVFEIFTRLHGEETYPGTGVGLAIVRRGVERMGGRVGVESTPGRGSRFWIALPLAETYIQ